MDNDGGTIALIVPNAIAVAGLYMEGVATRRKIGVSYAAAKLADPDLIATPAVGSGTTLARMLKGPNQTVECASCHDIHRTIGASATVSHDLIVDLNGGQLCLTCHNK